MINMIRSYHPNDRQELCDFFSDILNEHKDYISHGELQMGIATDIGVLAPEYKDVWLKYLDRQSDDPQITILVYINDNKIEGFIIFGIENDSADDYGVIYDLAVNPRLRGQNIGSELVNKALSELKEKGILTFYLESGVTNHSAHGFFEKFGFKHVSNIYLKQ